MSKSHENTSKYVDTSNLFSKNLNQRSLIPRWVLTPSLLTSHVWLYPRIILSKSNDNTSKYVDTVTFFTKTWTKGHWPLDDLWPHICWGHKCDSTQGSLCPSPMYVDTVINFAKNTTYYIHTHYIYYIHTTSRMSDHIVSFWTQFRQEKNGTNDLNFKALRCCAHHILKSYQKSSPCYLPKIFLVILLSLPVPFITMASNESQ